MSVRKILMLISTILSFEISAKTYQNLYDTNNEKGFFTVMKWQITRKVGEWPEWIEYDVKPSIIPRSESLRVTWVNHSSMLIQVANMNFLTDPIWSMRASPLSFIGPKRVHAPAIAMDELPKIDYVLISHDHYDHLDYPTIKQLEERFKPIYITGENVSKVFSNIVPQERIRELNWWQKIGLGEGLDLTFVPAHHWSKRNLFGRNQTLWGGFVITNNIANAQENIYFAGDTGYSKHFDDIKEKFGRIDLAMLPIGAYKPEWFMENHHTTPEEVVQVAKKLGINKVIPIHYGCFKGLADDSFLDPLNDLKEAINKHKVEDDRFVILKPGEVYSEK